MSVPKTIHTASETEILTARVNRLATLVEDLVTRIPADTAPFVVPPVYPDVVAWVEGRLLVLLERPIGGQVRWCSSWWAHPEVMSRLEACWRAWETLRVEPNTGMSVWYREHLDPCLHTILNPVGPFAACTPERQGCGVQGRSEERRVGKEC